MKCLRFHLVVLTLSLVMKNGTALGDGTLAHHLATNALGHASALPGGYGDELQLRSPFTTNCTWAGTFWLKNVSGLAATPVGYREVVSGQGLPTMVSPRHYLCASHMHPEGYTIAFLDTNNVLHWRKTLLRTNLTSDISVGILDQDLPPSVGFLPVLPANYTNYLPLSMTNIVQGVGMNQDWCRFSQPMIFANPGYVAWNHTVSVPGGLGTNWNVMLRGGDSSNPETLLIGNQLVLVSHNSSAGGGPNYANQIPALNAAMRLLSEKNHVGSDYQLTEFCLTNWPVVR